MRIVWVGIVFILSLNLVWAKPAPGRNVVAPDDPVTTRELAMARLDRAAAAIDQGRHGDALSDIQQAIVSGRLSAEESDWGSYLRARALSGLGRPEDAAAEARARFTQRNNPYAFRSLVAVHMLNTDPEAAAREFLELPAGSGARLTSLVNVQTVTAIAEGLRSRDASLRRTFLGWLIAQPYTGPASSKIDDALRFMHLTGLLGEGDIARASAQAIALETPSMFVALLTDKSYEALWADPAVLTMTPQTMLERVRARAFAMSAHGLKRGGDALEAARAFRAVGDPVRAIDVLNSALTTPRLKAELGRQSRVLMIEKAYAFADLSKIAEARAVFIALLDQFADEPVLTRLAYARVMEAAGQTNTALEIMRPLDTAQLPSAARAIGLMITVCASSAAGRTVEAKDALTRLQELDLNAAPSLLEAHLCLADDRSAISLIRRWLESETHRRNAIPALQLYGEPPSIPPRLSDRRRRLHSIIASGDVQDALKPHGRTLGWAFTRAHALSY